MLHLLYVPDSQYVIIYKFQNDTLLDLQFILSFFADYSHWSN